MIVMLICLFVTCTIWANEKPIRLIIPTAPGGSLDIIGRKIAARYFNEYGRNIVVDNRSSSGGIAAAIIAANSIPNGQTLFFASSSISGYNNASKELNVTENFEPIIKIAHSPIILVTNKHNNISTIKDLIEYSKKASLNFGTQGFGSITHAITHRFKSMAKIDAELLHYKGGAPQLIDLLSNQTQAAFGSLTQNYPLIISGKLNVIGVGGTKRIPLLSETPAIAEIFPGFEASIWYGIFAPKNTPAAVINLHEHRLRNIVHSPDFISEMSREKAEVYNITRNEFKISFMREVREWQILYSELK